MHGDLPVFSWKPEKLVDALMVFIMAKPYPGEFGQPSLLVVVNMVLNGLVDGFVCLFTVAVSFRMVGG